MCIVIEHQESSEVHREQWNIKSQVRCIKIQENHDKGALRWKQHRGGGLLGFGIVMELCILKEAYHGPTSQRNLAHDETGSRQAHNRKNDTCTSSKSIQRPMSLVGLRRVAHVTQIDDHKKVDTLREWICALYHSRITLNLFTSGQWVLSWRMIAYDKKVSMNLSVNVPQIDT